MECSWIILKTSSSHPTISGKIVFHKTSPWCQKSWALLAWFISISPSMKQGKNRALLIRPLWGIQWFHPCQSLRTETLVPLHAYLVAVFSFFFFKPWVKNHCWRRKWQPTPVLLPGKFHGQRSLVGYSPWGHRVGHDWATSLSLFTCMHWRRKWQPTPVFLPGESQAWRVLVGCRLWGRTESDTTEAT